MWRFWLAAPFFIGGVFFLAVGSIGLVRLPDIFTRMHATGKCDTLGSGLVLIALAIMSPSLAALAKYLLLLGMICVINPTSTHVIANVAYRYGGFAMPGTGELDLRDAGKEAGDTEADNQEPAPLADSEQQR